MDGVLQREVVLGEKVDALQGGRRSSRRFAQALIPVRVEGEVVVDKAHEGFACGETELVFVIADPAVELGADEVEVMRGRATLAFADCVSVLATQPRLD